MRRGQHQFKKMTTFTKNRAHSEGSRERVFPLRAIAGGRTTASPRLNSDERSELIMSNYESALRMALALNKRWGLSLRRDEVASVTGLVLCEAARRYERERGVQFLTYAYYFLKGALIQEASPRGSSEAPHLPLETAAPGEPYEGNVGAAEGLFPISPEQQLYHKELRKYCRRALARLSRLQQDVITKVHLEGYKVAAAARMMGYSRGHLSSERKKAFEQLRADLAPLHHEERSDQHIQKGLPCAGFRPFTPRIVWSM